MSRWLKYAAAFEEGTHNPYFEVRSAYQALAQVKMHFNEAQGQMIFLLGEPGSGKTFLLHKLMNDEDLETKPLMFKTPVSSPKDFFIRLIKHKNQTPLNEDIESLKEQTLSLYAKNKTLLLLDEAQLINEETIEYVRILADSRIFWIVCAMHEKEGREILSKSHFKSRPHKVIELGKLSYKESDMFINTQLIFAKDQHVLEFHQKHAKQIYKLSGGNFRYLKKLIYTQFSLLHEAQEINMQKFQSPSKMLLKMSAIEIGLLNV